MKLATFNDFVKVADIFYLSIGIEPYRKEGITNDKKLLITVIFYLSAINLFYVVFSEFLFVIISMVRGENFIAALMTSCNVSFVVVGVFKMAFIISLKEEMTQLINCLQEIFPNTKELQEEYKTKAFSRQCYNITLSFTCLYMLLIWTFNLFNILQFLMNELWLNIEEAKMLAYFMYVPWNWQNHWSYYLLYASQDFAGYTSASGHISGDLLLTACVTQLMMHYDYISYKLSSYVVKGGQKEISEEKAYALDLEFLKDMIKYHTKLLDLSDQINNIFSIPLLVNFSTSCFVICFVGFQLTIGTTTAGVIKLIIYLVSAIAQVYLICYHGQNMIDVSSNVAEAVYGQKWTGADLRYKKMLVLIAQRAQKPAVLYASSLVPITRGTMTSIMQISYKFFALLRTLYAE